MNSIHDMGGMHGLGPVVPETNEPVWHTSWESRVFAMNMALGAWRRWNIDAGRHVLERMPAADYLRASYYEKWLYGAFRKALQFGLITRAEAETGQPDPSAPTATPPLAAARVAEIMAAGRPTIRIVERPPAFAIGAAVRTRNIHPSTHTRLPRYARDKNGIVAARRGAHVFPDTNAQFQGENAQELYTVAFKARDLWGEAANPRDTVCIDLWEDYLAPA